MDPKTQALEERLSKLENESSGGFRFFTQYLLSPILVVVIGVIVNWQIEQDRKEVQQIKIAQSMLSTLFSDDEFKTMATKRLMDEVLQDSALKTEIGKIITDYMNSKFISSSESGDYESAIKVYTAVKSIGGETGQRIASDIQQQQEAKSVFSKYEAAKLNENKGFSALVKGDFEDAIIRFKNAYEVYPQYHSVSEIYRLLLKNKDKLHEENVRNAIIKKIVENYSWKAPQDSIEQLRAMVNS